MTDDRRVDDLRQQLRSLGYLDAGVDRFVLASAVRSRRPAFIALLASLRSGLIAAALLGPAAAVGLAARLPGLVTGVRDAVVLAIYMAVLFGAAVALLSFVAALAVSSVARSSPQRGRAFSTAAGVVVSLACLAYLTLWWRTANAGFGWQAPIWTAFALMVAVAISLLVGHVVTLTARAVMVARTTPGTQSPRVPSASWRLVVGAGMLAFAGAAALLLLTAPGFASDVAPEPLPLPVISTGVRVRMIAVDGLDPALFSGQTRYEHLPALSTLFSSARALLEHEDTSDPARIWTTVATGQPAHVHGVHELETRRVAGVQGSLTGIRNSPLAQRIRATTDLLRLTTPAIASGQERQEKAFWEVAAQAGLRTAVINWWATWPAPPDTGIVLTDRAVLRLEKGGELDAEIAPDALYERLRGRWPALRAEAERLAANALKDPPAIDAAVAALLQRSAEMDATQLALAREVEGEATDLVVTYLPGLDIAQHALLTSASRAPISASTASARVDALKHYYVALDRLLIEAVGDRLGKDFVFVLALPGRVATPTRGLLGMSGPIDSEAGALGRVVDVAPTILRALGVPISRELAGQPLPLFGVRFDERYPVRYVASYGRVSGRRAERRGQPLDEEAIERLRSLGYVR